MKNLAIGRALIILGKTFFVPICFMLVGAGLDLKMFANSLSTQLPFVLAILAALIVGKLVAAVVTQLTARYTWNEGLGMWSLSLPQLAATLAAALTAFQLDVEHLVVRGGRNPR